MLFGNLHEHSEVHIAGQLELTVLHDDYRFALYLRERILGLQTTPICLIETYWRKNLQLISIMITNIILRCLGWNGHYILQLVILKFPWSWPQECLLFPTAVQYKNKNRLFRTESEAAIFLNGVKKK